MRAAGFWLITVIIIVFNVAVYAQDTIYLKNNSFEDTPRKGGSILSGIQGWYDCGLRKFPNQSPPDIHPLANQAWGVTLKAYDGQTYLGLVVRDNDSYESVSQQLSLPLMGGECYSFSVYLARSPVYYSGTTRSRYHLENFTRPAIFRVWGGNETCDHEELLAQSVPVENTDWKLYEFILGPSGNYKYVTIEAFYDHAFLGAYNGHIMVDGISPIIERQCK